MARPNSRATLIDYCLRKLGHPVIEINVDDDQIEDRIDDALQMFSEYHTDGTQRVYLKHQVTQDDITNQYIPINDAVLYVSRVLRPESGTSAYSMFNIKYQMHLNDMYGLNFMGNINQYVQTQQYLGTIDMTVGNGVEAVTYNRHLNRIYLSIDWGVDILVDQYMIFECYRLVDPSTSTDVYDDIFVKNYSTALIKQQWGANLIKFEGMQLPGGVTLNGRQIYDDATNEIKDLQEKLRNDYEAPPFMAIG